MSGPQVFVVADGDARWEQALENCPHDVYHLPAYCRVSARVDGGHARAVVAHHRGHIILLPFVRREIDEEIWDATSPYGYGGPIWTPECGTDLLEDVLGTILDTLASDGCVSLFLRLHPGLNSVLPVPASHRVVRCFETPTVWIDLAREPAAIRSAMNHGHRSRLNQAERRGYTTLLDSNGDYVARFAAMYRKNMERMGARSNYYFDGAYFDDLAHGLGSHLALRVVLKDGELVEALFTAVRGWIQHHLPAAEPDHGRSSPALLAIDSARQWGQDNGFRWSHLGILGGARDSLLEFNSGTQLHTLAAQNIEIAAHKNVELVLANATQWPIPAEATVLFFFKSVRRRRAAPSLRQYPAVARGRAAEVTIIFVRAEKFFEREVEWQSWLTRTPALRRGYGLHRPQPEERPMKILLTCAGRRRDIVRAFQDAVGATGSVLVCDSSAYAPAFQDADEAFVVPPVNDDGYIDALLSICEAAHIDVLLPALEPELPKLAAQRARFLSLGTTPIASSPEVIATCYDKLQAADFVTRAGLLHPPTFTSLDECHAALANGEISFPLVVKPRWGVSSIGSYFPEDAEELKLSYCLAHKQIARSFLARASATDPARCILIQQRLEGVEYGLDVINDLHGNHVCTFAKKKFRMRAGQTTGRSRSTMNASTASAARSVRGSATSACWTATSS
jgi:carbamoyl-phosphate synthase large subunit